MALLRLPQRFDVLRCLLHLQPKAIPAMAMLHGTSERRRGATTRDNRWRRLLQRLRLGLHVSKGDVTALIRRLLLRPDGAHGLEILVSAAPTLLEWHPGSPKLGLTPADAEAEDESAIGQHVQRGE